MKTFSELKEALNQANVSEGKMKASELFAQVRSAITAMHFFHLTTSSYAAHIAAKEFYEGLVPILDEFVEGFSGRYGRLETFSQSKVQAADGLAIAINLLQWVDKNRAALTDDSELQNIIDEMVGLINSTIYKLRDLK